MPLTDQGFSPRNEDDILTDVITLATSLMGEDIDTSETASLGQFIRILAHILAKSEQDMEAIFLSWFYDTATGISLDRVAAIAGLTRNSSQPAYVTLQFTGKPGTVIDEDDQFETEEGQVFAMEDVVTLDDKGTGSGTAVSLEESEDANVGPDTITEQVMPVEDITSVTNSEGASGGAVDEEDEDFRKRISSYETTSSGATAEGIKSAIKNVTSVDQVSIVDNNKNETDAEGNPPKSLHIYVTGGTDADVAQSISDSMAAGTQTVGKTVIQVADDGGNPQEIHFDRPASVPIYMAITLQTDPNLFESDGVDTIKQNIADYINSLTMGATIRYTYMYTLVYDVVGVTDADIKIGRSTDGLAANDIKLNNYEAATYNGEAIEVTTNAS
ncbi:baseplate J/gp47 family protein [Lactiplantibacillus xiangfangensis]|uniref:baseplate J/gp47 family protein n=1 Tax=Lactiplantibacillus xiangfangensis TaxID=942150 RepID=UPI00384DE5B1